MVNNPVDPSNLHSKIEQWRLQNFLSLQSSPNANGSNWPRSCGSLELMIRRRLTIGQAFVGRAVERVSNGKSQTDFTQ